LPPVGLEPTGPNSQTETDTAVVAIAENALAQTLARELEKDPALARLIEAWPRLPEALRAGILAMIDVAGKG